MWRGSGRVWWGISATWSKGKGERVGVAGERAGMVGDQRHLEQGQRAKGRGRGPWGIAVI